MTAAAPFIRVYIGADKRVHLLRPGAALVVCGLGGRMHPAMHSDTTNECKQCVALTRGERAPQARKEAT